MSAKAELVDRIRRHLAERLERLRRTADATRAAATDPDSKAESKYDTRRLEASYLASGQARQVEEAAAAVRAFERLELPDFDLDQAIAPGALVEADLDGDTHHFLLVPAGGGLTLDDRDGEITLLSPDSPLYRQLLGLHLGDSLESPALTITELS